MSRYKISEHQDEIITGLLKNLIWLPIAGATTVIATLAKKLVDAIENVDTNFFNKTNLVLILLLVIMILLIILLVVSKKRTRSKSISSNFRAKSIIAELYFQDRKNISSKIIYDMTVLKNGVSGLERTLIWTGSSYNGTKLTDTNGNYTFIDSNRKNSPHTIKIQFDEEKYSKDIVKFTTITSLEDENLDMTPFYSFIVKHQIDTLTLKVVAPNNLIKNVKKTVFADFAKDIVVEPAKSIRKDTVGELSIYTFTIQNPTFLYNYVINWEFTN